jgi:hypothetical protein
MNRNQKIAIGCGGAGCLGLIFVAVVAAGVYYYYERQPPSSNRNSNVNISSNRSSNSNSSTPSDDTPSSSMSDDDKHKLFQAAGVTQDSELIQKVLKKIGLGSGLGSDYEAFVREHATWALQNFEFITSVSTPDKAKAYVEEHLDD